MIQYPKNTHMTLPSVEGCFGSMNIMRDPPKMLMTRYIEKVGTNNNIIEQIDGAGDRICEGINLYARGVNPMVSVSYSNAGTNGGQFRGDALGSFRPGALSSGQAYLPYSVNKDGAFRPPIIPPQDLIPLSRLPRITTRGQTNIGSAITTTAELMTCKTDLKEIRKNLLQVCVAPNATFNIQTPQNTPHEIKSNIRENKLQYSARTNLQDIRYNLGVNTAPERGINENKTYVTIPNTVFKNINVTPLEQLGGANGRTAINSKQNMSCSTNVNANKQTDYIHKPIVNQRNVPMACIDINHGSNRIDTESINAREYKYLLRKKGIGGFENSGFIQTNMRAEPPKALSRELTAHQIAAKQMETRFGVPFDM